MALNQQTRLFIEQTLQRHNVVLFMKGTRHQPRCGFSASVVQILDGLGVDYKEVDVLADQSVREGIKEYGNWPTIPQLYYKGNLIGGCDIIRQLDESGELAQTLGLAASASAVAPPAIRLDEAAIHAIREAQRDAEPGQQLRMELRSAGRAIDLYFDHPRPGDITVEEGGVTLLFDRASARLANGLSVEYVDGPSGGFKIDNPNIPAKVRSISAADLKARLDAREPLRLYDVRPPAERSIASIAGAIPLDERARAELDDLPKDTMLVFHCHHGVRSQAAAEGYAQRGFRNVWNLSGGIDVWSQQIDPNVRRY